MSNNSTDSHDHRNGKYAEPKSPNAASSSVKAKASRGTARSLVVTKPTRPWALIVAAVAVVVFAAFGVVYAIKATNDKQREDAANDPTKIEGLHSYDFSAGQGKHVDASVNYEQTPPAGGTHDPEWADCTGTVYPQQITNENAVHSLEHGAVWLSYDPALVTGGDIAMLTQLVQGKDFMMLSPYPSQGAPVSVQSWGHQLSVASAGDPRVAAFIDGFRLNPTFTPELGATCQNAQFKASPNVPTGATTPGQQ